MQIHTLLHEAFKMGVNAKRDQAASERATSEPAGPAKVVAAVATGSLPAESVQNLLKQWEEYAARYSANEPSGWWLRRCIDELRAEMARATMRQPEENKKAQTRSGESPSA